MGSVVKLEVRSVRSPKNPNQTHLVFSVCDQGSGIAPKEEGKLFKKFSQINPASKEAARGSGLGLSICKNLLDLLGGGIWYGDNAAESTEGEPNDVGISTAETPLGIARDIAALSKLGLPVPPDAIEEMEALAKKHNQSKFGRISESEPVEPVTTSSPPTTIPKGCFRGARFHFHIPAIRPTPVSSTTESSSGTEPSGVNRSSSQKLASDPLGNLMPSWDVTTQQRLVTDLSTSLVESASGLSVDASDMLGRLEARALGGVRTNMENVSTIIDKTLGPYPTSTTTSPSTLTTKSTLNPPTAQHHTLRKLPSPTTATHLTILVVDDDGINKKVLCKILKDLSKKSFSFTITTLTASNGQEALDMMMSGEWKFDVVFMDVMMPVMDGLEAVRRVCEIWPSESERPVMLSLTANAMQVDLDATRAAGSDFHVTKPVTLGKIKTVLCLLGLEPITANEACSSPVV
ncbi:hypothetical protein HDU67_003258 [Dinochytrium kinnereticum]|nr:hypothetical protein HDU67_003258 [Dinochytrium kinnereticum]